MSESFAQLKEVKYVIYLMLRLENVNLLIYVYRIINVFEFNLNVSSLKSGENEKCELFYVTLHTILHF